MKLLFLISFTLLLFGCDIFNARDTEKPNQPRSNYQPPATPDDLLSNLTNSLFDKDVNNYSATFSDENFTNKKFQFIPSSGTASQFPFFTDWNKQNEEHYFNNMILRIGENQHIFLELHEISRNTFVDSVAYTASYTLNVPFTDPELPQKYQGDLTFKMVSDARSVWSIYFWQDNKSTDDPTWSELKGRLSN